MPVRLEECDPPRRLRPWQYADYFEGQRERGLQRLLVSLKRRADSLGLKVETPAPKKEEPIDEKKPVVETPASKQKENPVAVKKVVTAKPKPLPVPQISTNQKYTENGYLVEVLSGIEFVRVPAGKFLMGSTKENKSAYDDERPQHTVDIPYDYWMARNPITNELYNAYTKAKNIKHPVDGWEKKKDHPVTYVKWIDAIAYCRWLNGLIKAELPSGLIFRLPTEAEWEKAARGTDGLEYPWGNQFDKNKCNTSEGRKGGTIPVRQYSPQGDSPYGCADMSGNVWEWTRSLKKAYPYNVKDGREDIKASGARVLRGGSFNYNGRYARCACRLDYDFTNFSNSLGFRVVVASLVAS